MIRKLEGRKALITGGSNGIGRAIAIAFAREGANLVFTYRSDKQAAETLVQEISSYGVNSSFIQCDMINGGMVDSLFESASQRLNGLDILVNNVGVLTRTAFVDIKPDELDRVMGVNFRFPFLLTQRFSRELIDRKAQGSILNISSLSAERTRSQVSHYQCSKAALNMLTRSVAYELSPYGIRANSISPGLTATRANQDQWESQGKVWENRMKDIPLGRAGIPNDHAGAAVFLVSEESSWITGANLVIDGGMSIF